IDLPADMQAELRALEAPGARVSHYELLGVPADADGAAVRRAYFERSKRLHPDAWYGKELGEFRPLLSKWFQKIAAAYQTLSDEESRAAYDQAHRADLSSSDRAALERRALTRAEEDRRERERRERLLRSKGFARLGAARKMYEDALALAANGERAQAISALKTARELDPNRKEITGKLAELEREQSKARAQSALMAAHEKEETSQWAQAVAAYAAAFQLEKSSSAAMGAARCAFANNEPQVASGWASRAVEVNPADLTARFMLARCFALLNMKARARTELAAILDKNPGDKEAKALLKSL
ncbi:MAG TPA: J domain-containing protein, partial [Myxococcales bacterium]|nr:J domain-containing protein [Myxococcales bacterium]